MTEPTLPETFGRYRVFKLLGRGAMGSVYLAEDTQLRRSVALKIPRFESGDEAEGVARLHREARAAATLRHPNICPIYDVGEIDGRSFISMAYLEGRLLSQMVAMPKRVSERAALGLIRKLALALDEAHARGIIHRDLKPANIMLDERREPIIMDFGLACPTRTDEARLTQPGVIVGSPAYMAPEQLEGDPAKLTPAVDQHSLGVVLFELLTGELPYRGSVNAVIGQILHQPVPSVLTMRPELSPGIDGLCARMMAKDPAARFPTMRAVADEITRLLAETNRAENSARAALTKSRGGSAVSADPESSRWAREMPRWLSLAQSLSEKHDYAEARRVLAEIPVAFRSAEVIALLSDVSEKDDESALLLAELEAAIRQQNPTDLQPLLKRFLRLKPGHPGMRRLAKEIERSGVEAALRTHRATDGTFDPVKRTVDPRWVVGFVTGLAGLCAAVYFAAVALQTPRGTVIVRVLDPAIEVTFGDQPITNRDPERTFTLEADRPQPWQVSIHGVTIPEATREIAVARNETKTVTAALRPDGTLEVSIVETKQTFTVAEAEQRAKTDAATAGLATAGVESEPAWEPLFDGQSFAGWESPTSWQVKDGAIEIHPERMRGNTDLQTKERFTDYELRFQFRLLNQGALALMLRFDRDELGWNLGPQLSLGYFRRDQTQTNVTGNLFALLKRQPRTLVDVTGEPRSKLESAVARGDWVDVHVRCQGAEIVAKVQGIRTVEYRDAEGVLPLEGRIGFYTPGYDPVHAELKGLEIRRLSPVVTPRTAPTRSESMPTVPITTAKPAPMNPAPSAGPKRFFTDDYQTAKPYWSTTSPEHLRDNPNHRWGYRDGIYFDESATAGWYFGVVPGGPFPASTIDVTCRVVGNQPTSRGCVLLKLTSGERGLQLRLDGLGRIWLAPAADMLGSFSGGPWLGPITHPAIHPGGGAYNRIRLTVRKRRLELTVNDAAVTPPLEFAWDLTPYSLGMGVDCQSPLVRAEYEALEVREDDVARPTVGAASEQALQYLKDGMLVLADGTHCYEGASLRGTTSDGTTAGPQWDLQAWQAMWTNDCQLTWWGSKPGAVLTIPLPVAATGLYQIVPGFTVGPDFGRFKLALEGEPLYGGQPIDLYDPVVQPAKPLPVATIPLTPGTKILTITVVGKNRASNGLLLGLDELRLIPVP
jgi:serine/threonine protein kinase